jgi:hypothetical protein
VRDKLRTIYIALTVVFHSAAVLGSAIYWGKSFEVFSGSSATTFTVSVDSDTQWSGTIDGIPRSGTGSANFTIHTTSASACLQKLNDTGYLTITIFKNGEMIDLQTTNEAYSPITVSAS